MVYDPYSDPYFEHSTEADDLVSKGFLSDEALVAKLDTTLKLEDVDLDDYDAITSPAAAAPRSTSIPMRRWVGRSSTSGPRARWSGAICHGAIALGNIPERVRGRRTTGYTLEGDLDLQRMFGSGFLIPHYPQKVLEEVGSSYSRVAPNDPYVVRDGKLVTGQNQQSASEYALVLLQALTGERPVSNG
ncbi:MAG: DJ-1/PfpI family protein [Caulobacteraceae bacterium]